MKKINLIKKEKINSVEILTIILVIVFLVIVGFALALASRTSIVKKRTELIIKSYYKDIEDGDYFNDLSNADTEELKSHLRISNLPDSIETLRLNEDGKVMLYIVDDGIACWNYGSKKEEPIGVNTGDIIKLKCRKTRINKTYQSGTVVYYNPLTNSLCKKDDSKSTTKYNDGCMKWYAFGDSKKDSRLKLLLDHNIVVSTNGKSVEDTFKKAIKGYSMFIKKHTRLLSLEDLRKISVLLNINKDTSVIELYGEENNVNNSLIGYSWVFENTLLCKQKGCSKEDNKLYDDHGVYGYWLNDKSDLGENYRWYINNEGILNVSSEELDIVGIRPVVEIDKDILD